MPLLDNFVPLVGNEQYPDAPPDQGDMMSNISVIRNWRMRRPYFDPQGYPCVSVHNGQWTTEKGQKVPMLKRTRIIDLMNRGTFDPIFFTANATAMRKEQWEELDRRVVLAYRQRLRAWTDLAAANTYGGFNAMSRLVLEYEAMSDPGEAIQDMDAVSEGRTDSPQFKLRALPLPITHGNFFFSQRRLEISHNGNTPLDSVMGEAMARRIAEIIEQQTIGTLAGMNYGNQTAGIVAYDTSSPTDGHGAALGGSVVYGYLNYPHRFNLSGGNFTAPTTGGWVPDTAHNQILAALDTLYANRTYGPFMVYHSIDWTQYMNRVYAVSGGNNPGETLRSMLLKNPDIIDVRRLDFLPGPFTIIIVQFTSETAQAVDGMPITTLQWPTVGGLRQTWKIMCIQVPLMRSDFYGRCGIAELTFS